MGTRRRPIGRVILARCAFIVLLLFAASVHATYYNFEAGHVRPLALSPDGTRLFAVNTPDNRLAIFDVTPEGLSLAAEIPVGMRPVASRSARDTGATRSLGRESPSPTASASYR